MDHDEIAAALESFVPPPMRAELMHIGPLRIVNDAYNSNPGSVPAALDVLASIQAERRVVVFGEMRELGERSSELHERVARTLAECSIDLVVLVGRASEHMRDVISDASKNIRVESCTSVDVAGEFLRAELRSGDAVLLKASRAVALERVIERIRTRFEDRPSA
jgi:UDP-N-acetylmuramoyl-tripeptide--D-alanyl-D-alanine ligase